MSITRLESKVLRIKAKEFRARFEEAESLEEMASLREEFFCLPYNYEALEKMWDYVDGSKESLRSRNLDLPVDEIIGMHKGGLSSSKIAEKYCTTYQTINRRIEEYYGG